MNMGAIKVDWLLLNWFWTGDHLVKFTATCWPADLKFVTDTKRFLLFRIIFDSTWLMGWESWIQHNLHVTMPKPNLSPTPFKLYLSNSPKFSLRRVELCA